MKELAKQYDPSQVEDRIYQFWLDGGYFHTKADPDKKPYTIVMPPPNVTGQLHMGHAVDNTMQDILIRTKRMQGYAALWVPGTDHASIATEAKVVEAMRAEGLTKEMVGRDGFLERAWAWKTKYGNRIVSQLKKLGSSCDWERERFTMDEGCSEAVKEVFVRLYDKGLIYRGNRMVNWCPHCNTSISDAEVEYEEKDGSWQNTGTRKLRHQVTQCHITDLDGDGVKEYILTDGMDLYVYHAVNDSFRKLWSTHVGVENFYGPLMSGDMNGDGVQEIYACDTTATTIRYILTEKGLKTANEDIQYGQCIYPCDFDGNGREDYWFVADNEDRRGQLYLAAEE